MKRIITNETGWEALLGENVLVFATNYIYAGRLTGVNEKTVELSEPKIVYETGPFDEKGYKDAQSLPAEKWNVCTSSVESFGKGK